jgi:hypothetical protein
MRLELAPRDLLIGESETLRYLLTNLINKKISYIDIFRKSSAWT